MAAMLAVREHMAGCAKLMVLVVLRALQEEEIRSIFTDDAPKPVGARLDIANTWFVQFTDEDDTKRAFDYVQGKEFKVGVLVSLSMGRGCAL
jgi:hypothetical protein